ncbi:anti-sigma factor antagonist [Actinosynnema sp. NPDC047251]|uniref:Anti-sigma factor antagonist n=1 Tax=Saccharothrix espanaensis (strain ATCC 51144 / DSM 44229 / JCM 9112 / NBRC 15066 / NRRL 15764) TaxID=1179773 RepID=K0K1Z8_SACES|nr:anti-sigma factor antagonist [Saccharothrix espanaensis]CCH32371.1 hypothetical protein BN6_51050 [Saccharothrix espanaensis DSM 44229]
MNSCTEKTLSIPVPAPAWDRALRVEDSTAGDAVIVRAAGEIDLGTAPRLDRHLHTVRARAGTSPVVLDLTQVVFLAATGLELLLRHHHACAFHGTELRIVATRRAVLHPLRTAGLDLVLHLHPTVPAALAAALGRRDRAGR